MADNTQLKTYTTCIDCEKPFEKCDPIVLPCLHSICSVCFEKFHEDISNACPRCFEGFPASLLAQQATDHRRKLVPDFIKNKSEGFGYVRCHECEENQVSVKCTVCDRLLCAECLKNHDKYTKGHKKINIDEMRDMCFLDTIMPLQCTIKNHQNLPLNRYCYTDQTVICDLCESTSHKAQDDHRVEDIETACLKKRHDLENVIAKCQGNIDAISNQAVNVQNEIDRLIQVKDRHENEIDAAINNIIEWLERRRTYLKAGLNDKINTDEAKCNQILKSVTNAKDALEETSVIAKYALEYVGPEDFCQIESLISNRHQVLHERVGDIFAAKMPDKERLLILPVQIMKLEELLSVNSWLSVIDYTLDVPEEITIGDPEEVSVKIATLTVNKSTHNESMKPFDIAVRNADDEEMQTQVTYDDINRCFAISSKISCQGMFTLKMFLGRNQQEERSLRVMFAADNKLQKTVVKNYNPKERIDHMDNEELVQRELQCPVCKEDFSFEEDKYPRLLPCLHIVGTDCLNKCVNGDQLTCPICEEIHEIKDENVDQLPRDYSRQNLEMYRQLKWDKNLVHCVEHESTKASFCCQTCGLFACDICSNNYHSRNGHVVSSLDEFDQNIQISQLHKNTLCDITGHSDKHIEFFCTECQRLICPKCYLEQHYTHEVTNYKSVYDDYLAKLRSICTRITEMKQATKELNGAAEDELQALDILADKELGKVRCVFNNHKLALDERKRTLETQVKGIRDDKQDVLKRQQYDLKNMEKCLEESLSRASDFQTFSNEKAFITNFSFVERRMQNAIEKPIGTTLSEQALLLFLETKHTKRFENETEHLGKIWPLPNLKYTVHPVILSTECLLVSIHFNDKRGTAVSIKDIKNYIQAVLLNDQHETIDRAITQIAIKENELLEIKGSIHEPGTYTLMVMIANSSIKKDGFTLIPEATGDKQYTAEKADAIDKQFEAMGIEEKQNDVDRAGVKAKEHFDKNASALTEEYLDKVDDSKDNGNSVKKRDFIDSEKFVEKEDSVCTEKLFGDGDSIEKERLFTKIDSEDMTELVEKHDTVDKGHLVDKQYSVVKEDYAENKEQLDRKRGPETNDKKLETEHTKTTIDEEEAHITRLAKPSGFLAGIFSGDKSITEKPRSPSTDIDVVAEATDDTGKINLAESKYVGIKAVEKLTAEDIPLPIAGAPEHLETRKISQNSVRLSWKKPKDFESLECTSFIIGKRYSTTEEWQMIEKVPPYERSCLVSNLPYRDVYFSVAAENSAGIGPSAETEKAEALAYPKGPPSAPLGPLRAVDVDEMELTLIWYPPEFDGDYEIDKYRLMKKDWPKMHWDFMEDVPGQVNKFHVTGLEKGRKYDFIVYAVNKIGAGEPLVTDGFVVTKTLTLPPPPSGPLQYSEDTKTLKWNPPEDDNQSITDYFIEYHDSDDYWHRCGIVPGYLKEWNLTGLIPGRSYSFRIVAANAKGESEPLVCKQLVHLDQTYDKSVAYRFS